jgi:hypothetical protein
LEFNSSNIQFEGIAGSSKERFLRVSVGPKVSGYRPQKSP